LTPWLKTYFSLATCASSSPLIGIVSRGAIAGSTRRQEAPPPSGDGHGVVVVSQLFTVDKGDLLDKIGTLSAEHVEQVFKGIYRLLTPEV